MKFARTRHALLWVWRQLLTWSLTALVLLAAFVGLGRQLMPLVADYKGDVEARLSAEAGVPVRIQTLRGEWEKLTPHLVAEGIELRDPRQPSVVLLRLPELSTRPALLASLMHLEPRLLSTLRGLKLHLQQLPDGRLQIAELSKLASTDPEAARKAMSLVLRQPSLVLEDSQLSLSLNGRPRLDMHGLTLTSINEGERHWLNGEFRVAKASRPLRFIMTYRGDPLDWRTGRLESYISLPVLELGGWLKGLPLQGWEAQSVKAGGDYWLDFENGLLQSVTARVEAPQASLAFTLGQETSRYELASLHGLVHMQRENGGWAFAADKLLGKVNKLALPAVRLAARSNDQGIELAASQLALAPLRELLPAAVPLPPQAKAWLKRGAPSGWLPHLRLTARRAEDGSLVDSRVWAEFKAVSVQASERYPGVSNLAGWLDLGSEGGLVYIDSRKAVLDLRQEFREPLLADRLRGGFRLRRSDNEWELQSGRLQVTNSDAQGEAVFSLYVPIKDPGASRLHLLAGLREARGPSAYRYVPWTAAGDETLAWLKSAITAGTVEHGHFLYDGPLLTRRDLPPHRMEMRFLVRDGQLAYQPGWPPVEGLQAEVVIDNHALRISSPEGRVYNTKADSLTAEIPDLLKGYLTVRGHMQGPSSDIIRLLRESPLKAEAGRVAEALELEGDTSGTLALGIPLAGGPVKVQVNAELPGNRLRLKREQLTIDKLTGPISFSLGQGLVSEGLSGRLFDEDIRARIGSTVRNRALQQVHVSIDGRAGVPALKAWSNSSLLNYLDGATDYQAEVYLPGDSRKPVQLALNSNLAGLRINLPAPLGKGVEPLPLRYLSDIGEERTSSRLFLGKRLNAGLVWQGGQLERALLRTGYDTVAWPDGPGIQLEGRMPRFNLADWQGWLNMADRNEDVASLPPVSRVELEAQEIWAGGFIFRSARVEGRREADVWDLRWDSERSAGRARVPMAAARQRVPTEVTVDRLRWPLYRVPEEGRPKVESQPGLQALPLNLQVRALRLDAFPNLPETTLSTRLQPSPQGLRAEQLSVSNSAATFKGSLDWQWRGGAETRLAGTLQSPDVSRLLSGLGYAPTLTSSRANATADISWPGPPEDFGLERLDGQLKAKLEDGRLLNISAVTSASRIFGLLDIDNIKRRLRLDFSDVTRRGISFDTATLEAQVRRGIINPGRFELAGPSLSAVGQGKVNLNTGELDQDIKVTVPMSSTLPVAAAVVGGPLVGGAVVAAEKVLDKQLGRLTTLTYHVSGDWDDPKVERRTGWGKDSNKDSGKDGKDR